VVRDPSQLAGRVDWTGFAPPGHEPLPTLDDLRRQARSYALLRDVLQPRLGIDQTIEALESLGESAILEADRGEEVLSLFAPEAAARASRRVPSLTRREHHAFSADSHVRINPAEPGEPPGSEAGREPSAPA